MRKFNEHVGGANVLEHVVTLVDAGGQLQLGILARETNQRLAHAALGSDNQYSGQVCVHFVSQSPNCFRMTSSRARFCGCSATSGKRTSSVIQPWRASAVFTGTGFA